MNGGDNEANGGPYQRAGDDVARVVHVGHDTECGGSGRDGIARDAGGRIDRSSLQVEVKVMRTDEARARERKGRMPAEEAAVAAGPRAVIEVGGQAAAAVAPIGVARDSRG